MDKQSVPETVSIRVYAVVCVELKVALIVLLVAAVIAIVVLQSKLLCSL